MNVDTVFECFIIGLLITVLTYCLICIKMYYRQDFVEKGFQIGPLIQKVSLLIMIKANTVLHVVARNFPEPLSRPYIVDNVTGHPTSEVSTNNCSILN